MGMQGSNYFENKNQGNRPGRRVKRYRYNEQLGPQIIDYQNKDNR